MTHDGQRCIGKEKNQSDKKNRKRLNEVAHPIIMSRLYQMMDKENVAFAEVPLLFEGGYDKDFDAIILVERGEEERINAIIQRDGVSRLDAQRRIFAQGNLNQWMIQNKNSLIILKNNIDAKLLGEKIKNLIKSL